MDVTRRSQLNLFRQSRQLAQYGAGNINVYEFVMKTVCHANTGTAIKVPSVHPDSRALYSTAEDLRGIHPDIMTAEEYMQDIDEGGQELNLLRTVENIRAES